jgi:bifunctional ADP-heptose synthase (sugar kinase/adenylyltransferase)
MMAAGHLPPDKLADRAIAVAISEQARREGRRVGLVVGDFDLLNFKDVRMLQKARQANDLLIVGLSTMTATKQAVSRRVKMLAALECVDMVVIAKDSSPLPLLEILKPTSFWRSKSDEHIVDPMKLLELGISSFVDYES